MAAPATHSPLSPAVQQAIAEQRKMAEQIRAQYGDPFEYMASIVRDSFDQEALEEALRESIEGDSSWNDEELDER